MATVIVVLTLVIKLQVFFNFRNIQLRMFRNNQMLQHRVKPSLSKQKHHSTPSPTRRNARNIKSFELLYNRTECYICHNFGHKASDFHLKNYKTNMRVN